MNKQHEKKNKMNKEEYINWISSPCFWAQWPSDKIADFSEYVNGHPELKIRDFIEILAKGNYPEFLNIVIDKFGASAFTPEDGDALILFKDYQSSVVADIVIERGISLEALNEYKNQLGHELSYIYNLDRDKLTIAYAKISDAIIGKQKGQTMNNTNNEQQEKIYTNRDGFKNDTLDTVIEYVSKISDAIIGKQKGQTMNNTQKGQTMNNTNNEQQEKIYTNRDGFKNYTLDTVLEYVSDTENMNKWLEKPLLPDWVKKGARFKYVECDRVYEISDIVFWREIIRCRCGAEFRFINFVAPIGKAPDYVPVEVEKDSEIPKWADAGHWVFDKVKKQVRYVDSTSRSLSNINNVALGFFDGSGWAGKIEEFKKRFSPADVKINN